MLAEFRKLLPNENCLYFGDTKNIPYGEKTKEQLISYSKRAFEFFERKKVKAVVLACNTTSAVVYEELKNDYNFKLYPIIQSVTSVIAGLPLRTVGVFATPATIGSHAYRNGIRMHNNAIDVVEIPCPSWVRIVEKRLNSSEEAKAEIRSKLNEMLAHNPDKIILGCTHYPYLLPQLTDFAPKSMFINPAEAFVKFIKSDLENLGCLNDCREKGLEEFFVSSSPEEFKSSASFFYPINSTPKLID